MESGPHGADAPGMARDRLARVRSALVVGQNPYEHVELDTATRLGGAMLLTAALFALVSLPLSTPSGPLGWPGVLGFLVATLGLGLFQIKRSGASRPDTLLIGVYGCLAAGAVYRASAGQNAPFAQLLFILAIYACMIHPLRRALGVLIGATAVAWSPNLYEPLGRDFTAATVSSLLLIWCFGLIVAGWMTRVRRQRGEAKANSALARIDALTGLQNRRALEEALPAAVHYHRRHNRPLALLVADLDDFKGINDTFGHQVGDDMLRKVAQSLTAALRLSDPCFRWGGDEFVAVLPEAGIGEASDIAARVRETVALSCRTPNGWPVQVTVGAAQLGSAETGEELLARADAELLEGKARRNAQRAVA
jgi:diguanylate cyclase (GGDEF)-like protein